MLTSLQIKLVSSLTGILLSIYALYVKRKLKTNPDYASICDIRSGISCTKVLKSRYGQGFGVTEHLFGKDSVLNIPNSIPGIAFYSFQMITCFVQSPILIALAFYSSCASLFFTAYLAFILFYVLKDICLVCIPTYLLNIILLKLNYDAFFNKF